MSAAAAWGHRQRPFVTSERGGVLRFRAAAKTAAATDECGECSQWQDKLLQCQHKPVQAQAGRATLPTQQVRRTFLRTPDMAAARMRSAEALLPHAVAQQRHHLGRVEPGRAKPEALSGPPIVPWALLSRVTCPPLGRQHCPGPPKFPSDTTVQGHPPSAGTVLPA
jgi:hypothetical protein